VPETHDEDLVAELRELSSWIETPEPADQRAAVRARLTRPARRRPWKAWVAAGAAALIGTVAAVAPARAAVLDAVGEVLRVAGIEVRRDAAPPPVPATPSPLPSVGAVSLAEARQAVPFTLKAPAELGEPDQVVLSDPDQNGVPRVVTLIYRGGAVRFDQFDGRLEPAFVKSAPAAEYVEFGTGMGVWLPGPHPVTYIDRHGVERTGTARLAGPTLIWSDGLRTYRLEGLSSSAEAKGVASSLK
jgi:hypothetical protein